MSSSESESIPGDARTESVHERSSRTSMTILAVSIGASLLILCLAMLGASRLLGKGGMLPPLLRPAMPITIATRHSIDPTQGMVLQLVNDTTRHLVIQLECENPTIDRRATFDVEVFPKSTKELGGVMPGIDWKFVSGDSVVLHHADYDTKSAVIP